MAVVVVVVVAATERGGPCMDAVLAPDPLAATADAKWPPRPPVLGPAKLAPDTGMVELLASAPVATGSYAGGRGVLISSWIMGSETGPPPTPAYAPFGPFAC